MFPPELNRFTLKKSSGPAITKYASQVLLVAKRTCEAASADLYCF